jgi:DNA repair protein RadA/Sms
MARGGRARAAENRSESTLARAADPSSCTAHAFGRPAGLRAARRGRGYSAGVNKAKSIYTCTECGGTSPKWLGKCPSCGAWNTLVESVADGPAKNRYQSLARGLNAAQPVATLSEIEASEVDRQPTGIDELDRVLGGGIVAGGVVLIGGDPGIGKSTLLLQALDALSRSMPALYVTGEESGAQVALRSRRLGLDASQVRVLAEINLEKIIATIDAEQPAVCVIDSIQTVYSEELSSAPGSVAQVRECAAMLTRTAKSSGTTIVLVGHVTKEGALAGPRVLEHIVDTVLYFEGDTHSSFRLVRAIKNRFGAVNEIGVFAMTEKGLKGVSNPSAIFLSTHGDPVAGSCVLVTLEGTRPMLVEIQALVDSGGPSPRRLSVGLERDRLAMMLAVLHRHAGIACFDQDVFVNAVGGVRISEPAADLAVMLAIQSSLRGRPLPRGFIAFGEVGLAGEVRPAPRGQERLKEAAKLGFSVALVPKANAPKKPIEGLTIHPVERIEQAIDLARSL